MVSVFDVSQTDGKSIPELETQEKIDALPDEMIGLSEMHEYGYTWNEILPLTKEKALALFEHALPLYVLNEDSSETTVEDKTQTQGATLEAVYEKFNIDHPVDYKGHSLSVSDIVVLHQDGENTAHFVDSFGFTTLPEFLKEQATELEAVQEEMQDTFGQSVQKMEINLFVGDALMNMFYPTVSMLYVDEQEMLSSAKHISELGDKTIYFGHGKPKQNRDWIK